MKRDPVAAVQGNRPVLSGAPLEQLVTEEAQAAADEQLADAVRNLLASSAPEDAVRVLRDVLRRHRDLAKLSRHEADRELAESWKDGGYPYKNLLSRKSYEQQKFGLQVELLKLQAWVKEAGQRVVVLFEGRDAAGKGGTIRRFMEHMNPRGARVVALGTPTELEKTQWYFQRYVQHLPAAGEIVLFDRSRNEYEEFMRQAPEFERMLVRQGMHLVKFWFSVSRHEQRSRFKERENHPLKQWKLSPVDRESLDKWDEYTRAKEAMFLHTDTADAPWTVIKSDCKKRARLNAMRYLLHVLPYAKKDAERIGAVDTLLVGRAQVIEFGRNGA